MTSELPTFPARVSSSHDSYPHNPRSNVRGTNLVERPGTQRAFEPHHLTIHPHSSLEQSLLVDGLRYQISSSTGFQGSQHVSTFTPTIQPDMSSFVSPPPPPPHGGFKAPNPTQVNQTYQTDIRFAANPTVVHPIYPTRATTRFSQIQPGIENLCKESSLWRGGVKRSGGMVGVTTFNPPTSVRQNQNRKGKRGGRGSRSCYDEVFVGKLGQGSNEVNNFNYQGKEFKKIGSQVAKSSTSCAVSSLGEIVRKATEKNQLTNPEFWKKYPDIQTMAAQTNKEAVVEILENFAEAHKKQVFLFQRLKATILRNLWDYIAPDLSTICHSFVVLGFLHDDFVVAMAPRIVTTAHLCTASQLTRLLDAYASLRCNSPEPLRVITTETLKKLQDFEIGDLMTHASSFARLNLHNHRLFSLIAERILTIEAGTDDPINNTKDEACDVPNTPIVEALEFPAVPPSSAQQLLPPPKLPSPISKYPNLSTKSNSSNSTESDASLSSPVGSTAEPSTASPLSSREENSIRGCTKENSAKGEEVNKAAATPAPSARFSARDLTLAAYSFAKLGFHFPSVFQFVSRHAKSVIRDFTAHQIQMVAVAFQRSGIRDVDLFHEISVQAQRRMAQFNAESVALLLRSYSLFDIRDEALFTRVVAQLPRLILTFRPLDVATTLNAFARLNVSSPALMAIVVPHILEDRQKFGPSDLQSILHACAKLGNVNVEFLQLLCEQCDLSQLSVGQLTLVASDLPKVACKDLKFLMKLQETLFLKKDYFNVTMMTQILSAFLYLELYEHQQFLPFMQFLSAQVRAAWEAACVSVQDTVSVNGGRSTDNRNNIRSPLLPIPLGAVTNLCLAELATVSAFTHTDMVSVPDVLWTFCPVHPTELFYRLLASQYNTAQLINDNSSTTIDKISTSNEHGIGSTLFEVVEQINLIRAAMQSLSGFPKEVGEAAAFSTGKRCSSGCLYGTCAGSIERETEFALQEIALVLQNSGGLSKITIHLPSEIHYDETHFYTSAPHFFASSTKSTQEVKALDTETSRLSCVHVKDKTNECSLPIKDVGSMFSPSQSDLNYDLSTLHQKEFISSSSRCSLPHEFNNSSSIQVSDMDTEIIDSCTRNNTNQYDQDIFQLLPYHSFLTIPQGDLNLLRRWIPGQRETPSRLSSEMSGRAQFDSTRQLASTLIHDEDGLVSSDGYSCSSGFPCRQRARSQSDSLVYGRIDLVSDDGVTTPSNAIKSQLSREATPPSDSCQENQQKQLICNNGEQLSANNGTNQIEHNDPAFSSIISDPFTPASNVGHLYTTSEMVGERIGITSVPENCIREVRSNSEILMRGVVEAPMGRSMRPAVLILWGSSLHCWHQMNPFASDLAKKKRENEIEWATDLFDDEDDDDDEFNDEQVRLEVEKALKVHQNSVHMLTPMAKLQLRIFASLIPSDIQLFLILDFVWHSLKLIESRRAFLASFLLDTSNSVQNQGFNRPIVLPESTQTLPTRSSDIDFNLSATASGHLINQSDFAKTFFQPLPPPQLSLVQTQSFSTNN